MERKSVRVAAAGRHSRFKAIGWPLAIVVPVVGLILLFIHTGEPEPLAPRAILEKQEWTANELGNAIGRAMAPNYDPGSRQAVQRHLYEYFKQLPAGEQSTVTRVAVRHATRETLAQLRAMPENDRRAMHRKLYERSIDNYLKINHLPPDKKADVKARLQSESGHALTEELTRAVQTGMTADERRDLAPVVKVWIKTINTMER